MIDLQKIPQAWRQLGRPARHFGVSRWWTAKTAARLHNRNLFSLEDIIFWGLTDPAIPVAELDAYISREARVRLEVHFNRRDGAALVDDKRRFYERCRQVGVRCPDLVAELPGIVGDDAGISDEPSAEWLAALSALEEGQYVAKPAHGMKGKGISSIHKRGGVLSVDGVERNLESACRLLRQHAGIDAVVLQKRLVPHPGIRALSGSDSLQTVRAVTLLVERDGRREVHLLFALFKIVVGGNLIDNFADGVSGNLIAPIDLGSGRLGAGRHKRIGDVGLGHIARHPETGAEIPGFALPLWPELRTALTQTAGGFPELRLLAWDVAITPDGIVFIEANQEWEIFSIAPFHLPTRCHTWRDLLSLG